MSKRFYDPSSYEGGYETFQEKKRLLPRVRQGLISGYPSPDNPLGLYRFYFSGTENGSPTRGLTEYTLPYEAPTENDLDAGRMFEKGMEPDEYEFAASLVFGGILKYATANGISGKRLHILNDTEMLNFTTALTFRLMRQIAKCALTHMGAETVEDIVVIAKNSYEPIIEQTLTRCRSNIAQAIEASLGVSTPPLNRLVIPSQMAIDPDIPSVFIETNPVVISPRSLCSGTSMLMNGRSYTEDMWNRALDVCTHLPWLFQAEVEKARITSKTS